MDTKTSIFCISGYYLDFIKAIKIFSELLKTSNSCRNINTSR